MSHPLDGAFAKYDAALAHFVTLCQETAAYLETKPYSEAMQFDERKSCFSVACQVAKQPSMRFATRIGDVVHNLSSALDLAMYELAYLRAGCEVPMTSFPIFGSVIEYRKFRRGKKCWMKHLTTADRTLIQRFQPYRGGDFAFNHPLAQLYRLWNQDKHRALHTTLAMVAEYQFKGEIVQDIAEVVAVKARVGAVVDGAEILRIEVVTNGPDPQMKLKSEITLDIGVDDSTHVRSLLAETGNWVEHILNRVSEAFPESPTWNDWKAAQAES